jgi:hypothetical protein
MELDTRRTEGKADLKIQDIEIEVCLTCTRPYSRTDTSYRVFRTSIWLR